MQWFHANIVLHGAINAIVLLSRVYLTRDTDVVWSHVTATDLCVCVCVCVSVYLVLNLTAHVFSCPSSDVLEVSPWQRHAEHVFGLDYQA